MSYDTDHAGWLLAASAPSNIAKGEKIYETLTRPEKQEALAYRDMCLDIYACHADYDRCEPDARNYKCHECGERQVFGAEETMMPDTLYRFHAFYDNTVPDMILGYGTLLVGKMIINTVEDHPTMCSKLEGTDILATPVQTKDPTHIFVFDKWETL